MDARSTSQEIQRMRESGMSVASIARELGEDYHRVYRLLKSEPKDGRRADAGRSRTGLYERIVPKVLDAFLQQGKLGNLQACIDRVFDDLRFVYPSLNRHTLRRHVDRAYRDERWDLLWQYRKDKPGFNQHLPKLNYDRSEWPFMGFFVMDNRVADTRVYSETLGRMIKPYQYYIYEGCTGRILGFAMKEEAFTRIDVARLIINTVAKWGRPLYGFICDNGSEQIGGDSILMMECLWEDEYIQACRMPGAVPELHMRFDAAISPVITSLARIPTFPMKAALERTFAFIQQHFDAMVGGHAFAGTGRGDQVTTSLVRSPRRDSTTLYFDEYHRFCTWYLTAPGEDRTYGIPYLGAERRRALRAFALQTGLEPTIGEAWNYHAAGFVPQFPPVENLLRLFMYTEQHLQKRVTKINQVRFQLRGEWYCFNHPGISYRRLDEIVDVILDPADDTRALIMHRGEVLGIADDLDRKRRKGQMSMAESRYFQRQNRNQARAEIKAASDALAPQRRPAIPDTEPERMEETPFSLGGLSYGDVIAEVIETRLDETAEPDIELDEDIQDFQAKYLRR
jgi:hypothetical protein